MHAAFIGDLLMHLTIELSSLLQIFRNITGSNFYQELYPTPYEPRRVGLKALSE